MQSAGTASSERRPEQPYRLARGVLDRLLASLQFRERLRAAGEDQVRMRERVIANRVSLLDDFANDIGSLLDEAADQEKSSARSVTGKNFQQSQGMGIIGTVVIGERKLLRTSPQPDKRAPKPLRCREFGLVRKCARGGDRTGASKRQQHQAIVNGSIN